MKFISAINSVLGGIPMISILLLTGIFCTVRLRGVQFRKFGHMFNVMFGSGKQKREKGTLTPFQALCTALASTVGTGNIVGVAGAITLGGPGAVFWMWIAALFGMATKYSEIALALKYRIKNANREWAGGPMYYIRNGLGLKWKWLAYIFAACCALAAFGTGNMVQINAITATVSEAVIYFVPGFDKIFVLKLILGIVVAVSAVFVFFGGIGRIGKITEKLTPAMSLLYIVGALAVVICNISRIGEVLGMIVKGAFDPSAFTGGVVGITIVKTMEKGIGRGIFSNEAGLGSAPIAHATANTDSPCRQAMLGIFEVFITVIICSITAFAILSSGVAVDYGTEAGASLTTAAFASVMGDGVAKIFIAAAIALFALSTIYGWVVYGVRCIEFLFGKNSVKYYYAVDIVLIIVGAVAKLDFVWAVSDMFNYLMAIPNLIAVLALSHKVVKMTKEYFGEKSVTGRKNIPISDLHH